MSEVALKILQVSPAYYPAICIGGPIFSTLALSKSLVASGHALTTLTTPLGLNQQDTAEVELGRSVQITRGHAIVYQPYSGYAHFTWSPPTLRWLRQHAKEFDLLILHGVWNFPLLAAAWICQRQSIPYVLYPHGTLYRDTVTLRSGLKKRIMLALFVRRMLRRAARVVFTTSDEAQKVQAFLGLKLSASIVPNIVDHSEFESLPTRGSLRRELGIPADSSVLLHLGRIATKKGLNTTLDVLARLRVAGRKVSLLIVGGDEGGLQAQLELQAQRLGIEAHVYFTGLLGRQQTLQALVDSDVFILPSLSENFGMAVVEAMLASVPVVISDHVGLAPDVASAAAGVVVPLSGGAAAFTDAVGKLLDMDEYRRELGAAGRYFAIANYSNSAVSGRVESLLKDAVMEARHALR